MESEQQEALLTALARTLAGRDTGVEGLRNALALLCERFAFDCAFLYETNQANTLCQIECCGTRLTMAQKEFSFKSLHRQLCERLVQATVLHCAQDDQTVGQAQLLGLLGATSASVIAVVDDVGQIYGMMALCNKEKVQPCEAQQCATLEVAYSVLYSHAAAQMYRNRLSGAKTALESILDNTGIDIYVNDFYNHDILYVNKSMAAPYGGQLRFDGRKCWEVLFPGQSGPCEFCPQNNLLDERGDPSKIYTWDYQRAFDGSWFRVFSAAFRWTDGRLAHVVSSADITDNKRNEALIQYMANYDALTKLPNRRMLLSACEARIQQGAEKRAYLLFFDIDGFKKINDQLGHDAGDEFLVQLGEFFSEIPMLKDSIYRNGGDEFVALLGERITKDNVRNLAYFIHARFRKPWQLKNGVVMCNTSIGVAQYPEDGQTSEELLSRADQAMYRAKKAGGGAVFFAGEE